MVTEIPTKNMAHENLSATCTYENLKKSVKAIEGMVGRDLAMPVIQNILIETKNQSLYLSATNLEIGAVQKVPAKTNGDWRIVIAPKLLTGFLTAIRGGEHITLIKDGESLIVKNDSYESEIKGLDAEDFPIIPLSDVSQGTSVDLQALQRGLTATLPFVTHTEIRPELTGVYVALKGDEIYMVATDSFRLGEKRLSVKTLFGKDVNRGTEQFPEGIILPQRICHYISRLDVAENPQITWYIHENHLSLQYGDLYITTRLIDANYPDYTQIIPMKTETNVILKKEDLIESMRVMMVFSQNEVNEIVLRVNDDVMDVQTRKQDSGSSVTSLNVSVSGDEKSVVVNPRYILEGIQGIQSEEVFIGINTDAAPLLFRGSGESGIDLSYTHIVMPIKNN